MSSACGGIGPHPASAHNHDCVAERPSPYDQLTGVVPAIPGPRVQPEPIWHVAKHRGRTSDFTPIRCSADDEGITFPGPIERRQPTCLDCIRILQARCSGDT